VLFSLYSRDLVLARFEIYRPTRKEVKMAATMDRLDVMADILKKLSLGHLTELFHREKITPGIISMLSTHEMNQLGITSRVDMMNLRLKCCIYGRQKPEKKNV